MSCMGKGMGGGGRGRERAPVHPPESAPDSIGLFNF